MKTTMMTQTNKTLKKKCTPPWYNNQNHYCCCHELSTVGTGGIHHHYCCYWCTTPTHPPTPPLFLAPKKGRTTETNQKQVSHNSTWSIFRGDTHHVQKEKKQIAPTTAVPHTPLVLNEIHMLLWEACNDIALPSILILIYYHIISYHIYIYDHIMFCRVSKNNCI